MSDSRRFNKTRTTLSRRALPRPALPKRALPRSAYSWRAAATTGTYCNAGDGDCQLIYNLYRNINNNLEDQNKKLDAQFKKVGEVYSTDYQKSNYQNANVTYYKFANSILFLVYYILVAAIAFIVVRSDSSRIIKALLVIAFVVYPFVINNIEFLLYGLMKYIYAILSGTVYVPPEF
jgi:hypothetical protein